MAAGDPRHCVRLGGVAEEERAGLALELEPVDHLRLAVPVRVDVDVVAGVRGERVVVRPRRRILAADVVGDDRDGVRLVRAPERVEVRAVDRGILGDERPSVSALIRRPRQSGSRPRRSRHASVALLSPWSDTRPWPERPWPAWRYANGQAGSSRLWIIRDASFTLV